jgi:DNA helicase-4
MTGDVVWHPEHGRGSLVSGWIGHLVVDFRAGQVRFSDADGLVLSAAIARRQWLLCTPAESAERARTEKAREDAREEQRRAAAEEASKREEEQKRLALLAVEEARLREEELEKSRQAALAQVHAALAKNFLQSDQLFEAGPATHLSRGEYEQEKITFVQRWVAGSQPASKGQAPIAPDDEQALAIATVDGHVQLVARAGSGKTETVANRAVFLQKHCNVAPTEMLLLAFNRDAAQEMTARVTKKLGKGPSPHIMTFHALAYALVPGAKALLVNTTDGSDQSLNQEFQSVLLDAMTRPDFEHRVRSLMLAHFRADWESIVRGGLNLGREEMLLFRRSLVNETLRGEYVKSYGEKVIANFLFEHDIPYFYEQHHWVSGRNYRPDFTVPKSGEMSQGVVIEYFGLEGDPDYDELSAKKRAYWETKTDQWAFIDLGPNDWNRDADALEACLRERLAEAGIPARRLSEDEIWLRARQRSILRFTEAVSGFVGRCRKQWRTPQGMRELMLGHHYSGNIERLFVELAVEIYELYLDRLDAINADDFDGLLQRAAHALDRGVTRFSRKAGDGDLKNIRYLFVDEYQDFTELFHQLIAALRVVNPDVRLFCVGDDWQAINRFAGSDLKFYREFDRIFEPASRLQLTTNRRSKRELVRVSNSLMFGRGTPAQNATEEPGVVALVDLNKFRPTSLEESLYKRSILTPVVLRLAGAALAEGQSVVLLSARNVLTDPGGMSIALDRYLKSLRERLPHSVRERLTISTAHGFKGNQCDVVIVLDATERNYPLIHPNWIFSRILGESESEIVDESRRLFYVALTRAKHALFLITESGRRSPFLSEISSRTSMSEVVWSKFPPILQDDGWLVVKVLGAFELIEPLISGLKADSFRYRDMSRSGGGRTWDRAFRTTELTGGFLINTPWMLQAKAAGTTGVKVQICDGLEKILGEGQFFRGNLVMTASAGTSTEFDITQLWPSRGAGRGSSGSDLPSALTSEDRHG